MIQEPEALIEGFVKALGEYYDYIIDENEIIHEHVPAPHDPPNLKPGKGAIYVFSLTKNNTSPAGQNRVLKVGKVGPNSEPRFKYQHYNPDSARSTLAGTLLNSKILWECIGFDNEAQVGSWLKENTDRDHFFIDGDKGRVISLMEVYARGILSPIFEG